RAAQLADDLGRRSPVDDRLNDRKVLEVVGSVVGVTRVVEVRLEVAVQVDTEASVVVDGIAANRIVYSLRKGETSTAIEGNLIAPAGTGSAEREAVSGAAPVLKPGLAVSERPGPVGGRPDLVALDDGVRHAAEESPATIARDDVPKDGEIGLSRGV